MTSPWLAARVFTEAESAQNHCQIGNMGLALSMNTVSRRRLTVFMVRVQRRFWRWGLRVILDWLDETGGRTAQSAERS